jgi:hypothetical protein
MNPPSTVQDREIWLKHCCEARALAQRIIDGAIGVIEGSREMVAYGERLHARDTEEFRIFLGIDSESDGFPMAQTREHWSADALGAKDSEIKAFEDFYRARAVEAAAKILKKFK